MTLPRSFKIPGDPSAVQVGKSGREVRAICAANPNASVAWARWAKDGAFETMITDPSGAYWFVVANPDGTTIVL